MSLDKVKLEMEEIKGALRGLDTVGEQVKGLQEELGGLKSSWDEQGALIL